MLNAQQRAALSEADRDFVRDAMALLQENWAAKSWLSNDNSYRKDPIGEIRRNKESGQNFSHLSEYIAASVIVHCFDGWSYLGRALEAEMTGAPDIARHLGYYAELRAAMSLLASEGIGVFNKIHIVVTNEKCMQVKHDGSSHTFTWEALEDWAKSRKSTNAVLRVVKPGGIPLEDWFGQFSASADFVATDWLRQWGLDLSRLAYDRAARNFVSYRPTSFTSSGPKTINETMDSILRFWRICDPEATGGFPVLDRHLLRISLELIFKGTYKQHPKKVAKYRKTITRMLDGLNPIGETQDWWERFLNYKIEPNPLEIVTDAGGKKESSHPHHSKQVLARAALLLRVATGSAEGLLTEAEPGLRSKLSFWLDDVSVRRYLWSKSNPPSSFQDLWLDVKESLDIVRQWMDEARQSECYYDFWDAHATEASVLSAAERAFLWGVRL